MRKLVLKGLTALVFGLAAAYSAYAAAIATTSEHCIMAASIGFLCLTLSLAFLPELRIDRMTRRSEARQGRIRPILTTQTSKVAKTSIVKLTRLVVQLFHSASAGYYWHQAVLLVRPVWQNPWR